MKWFYFQRWLFIFMIPLMCFLGYVNILTHQPFMLALNVFTILMSFVNIAQANRLIKLHRKAQQDQIWRLLGGKVK